MTLKDPTAPRKCLRCGHEKPYDHFYASGHGNGRRRVCIRCVREADRAKAGFRRHPRYNARGEVWCNYCERYRSADHFRFVSFPSLPKPKYWAYCKDCTREIDRVRYHHSVSTSEGKAKVLESRYKRHRRQRETELRQRREFVLRAIETIRRRGFTISEVSRLSGISLTTLYGWQKHDKEPSRAAESRLAIVLCHTGHLPVGELSTYRRRLPHPELAFLIKRIAPELAKHPMRNSWKYGARDHERRKAA